MKNRNALKSFKILLDNVRGIKSKINSINDILTSEKPAVVGLCETKLNEGDMSEIEGYIVKRSDRKEEGGGVLLAYREDLKNIMKVVREENEKFEMLWIKLDNNKVKMRIGIVYMPQEDSVTVKELSAIYKKVQEEIEMAVEQNERILLMGDFNCKVGVNIPGNHEKITKGGRILLKMVNKYDLCLLNKERCCKGTWTRIEGSDKSILDYMIVRKEDVEMYTEMFVDEGKDITPYRIETYEQSNRIVYSDHCMIKCVAELKVECNGKVTNKHMKLDKKKYTEFAEELAKEQVSKLIDCNNLEATYTIWNNKVMEICEKHCVAKKKKKGKGKCNRLLLKNKHCVTKELKKPGINKERIRLLKMRKTLILEHLESERMAERKRKIEKTVQQVKEAGGVDSTTFWEVKKKLMGSSKNELAAIIDENGVKREDEEEVKEVYERYFKKLLQTQAGTTEAEKRMEESVGQIMKSLETLCKATMPTLTKAKEVTDVISKLDTKKARDSDAWSNEIVVNGGVEMENSLVEISRAVDKTMTIPGEWMKMAIRILDKKGSKLLMTNKRGIFLTSIISKIYERIIKNRNADMVKIKSSQWQMGGVKKRSTTDNLFITLAIIERNKYLGRPTYVFYADVEKCFDRLWLADSVIELWRQGTSLRDAVVIKRMNEEARITVRTPVGNTKEIVAKDIVRQGTVYGPQLCGVSMSRINNIGKEVVTFYGPNLKLQPTQFVDDVSSAGSPRCVNNTVYNCRRLEETKKMSFNNENGKTEYTVVHPKKNEVEAITNSVKKGMIQRVKEHKSLGLWIDERGTYMINIEKNNKRVPHMIQTVRSIASPRNLGTLAVESRIKLVNAVIMPSILHNIEVVPMLSKQEVKKLESTQQMILTKMLDVPRSTPYMGLLLEMGIWTMEARIDYKKLMLYHNIKHSENERIIKKILNVQEDDQREGTWNDDIIKKIIYYGINKEVENCLKSEWKREVKEKIGMKTEQQIREECGRMRKTRTILNDEYVLKNYLKVTNLTEATDILRCRLHMTKLTCNYGHTDNPCCPLCGFGGKMETEHYFSQCPWTKNLANVWKTNENDLSGSLEDMRRATNHLKKIEIMMEHYMEK